MQEIRFNGLIVIREPKYRNIEQHWISALPLWCSLIQKSLNLNYTVKLGLFLHLNRDLPHAILKRNKLVQFYCICKNNICAYLVAQK